MRWRELFEDLEAQLQAAEAAELQSEVAERTRTEQARTATVDRVRAAAAAPLSVAVPGHGVLRGAVADAGVDWLLLTEAGGREALVPLAAVLWVGGLPRDVRPADPGDRVGRALDLRWALRGLARDRSAVLVGLVDGTTVAGTLDRVGADHVEVAEHAPGEPRRAVAVRGVRLVPLTAVALVRRG